jgi:hypothetical protein
MPPTRPSNLYDVNCRVLRCSPSQVELHVARLQAVRNKPKISHVMEMDGHHRAAFKP